MKKILLLTLLAAVGKYRILNTDRKQTNNFQLIFFAFGKCTCNNAQIIES
jgi:hypothetical protein